MALINLRNALMTGKWLPYDAEVEYLESTGTQYILLPGAYYRGIDIAVSQPIENVTYGCVGRWNGGSRADTIRNQSLYSRYLSVVNGDNSSPVMSGVNNASKLVDVSVRGKDVVVAGVQYQMGQVWSMYLSNLPWALFGCYQTNNQSMTCQASKIGACKLYAGNEHTLKYDLIPVRKGTVGYLYDRVSGKLFGNAGTGDFVLGPDVVPVEYLECGGSGQYINTGVQPDANTKWTLEAMFPSVSTFMPMGAISTDPSRRFIIAMEGSNKASVSFGTDDNILDISTQGIRQTYEIDAPNFTWRIGSTSGTFSSGTFDISGIGNLFLFARSRNGSVNSYNANSRVYRSTVYKSNALFQDALPVRVGTGSTWEGAMMDVLTRRIYRNAGTGAFTYGNDLKYPIPA